MSSRFDILELATTLDGGEPRSLSQQAYHHIRRKITSLELAPGAVIDERALK